MAINSASKVLDIFPIYNTGMLKAEGICQLHKKDGPNLF